VNDNINPNKGKHSNEEHVKIEGNKKWDTPIVRDWSI